MLTGSTEPNDTVTIYDGNTPVATGKADGNGTYTITSPTLANGDHALVAVATDPAGNVGSPSSPLDLTVDTVAPGAPLLGNVNGATLSDGGLSPDFTVTGTAAAQTTVTLEVDGVAVAADSADTRASGAYTIDATDLSPGTHTLTVTATDGAGNVSQPSTSTTVTISSQPVGTPGPSAINGTLLDGPIAGATVFADANGNGVLDTGESSVKTTLTGGFSLASATGELVATGGVDTQTGVAIPGPLTAPAGSTVIDPLTTLLDAYATATGQTAQAAQPALLTLLGLDPTADLTTLNPETVAGTGDPSFLIASAKVMDTAVVFADLAAAQTGASSAHRLRRRVHRPGPAGRDRHVHPARRGNDAGQHGLGHRRHRRPRLRAAGGAGAGRRHHPRQRQLRHRHGDGADPGCRAHAGQRGGTGRPGAGRPRARRRQQRPGQREHGHLPLFRWPAECRRRGRERGARSTRARPGQRHRAVRPRQRHRRHDRHLHRRGRARRNGHPGVPGQCDRHDHRRHR